MRSPRWIPGRTGALLNLSGTTNIIEATKAILEGLAFNLRRAFETVSRQTKDLGEISDVVATGGMCQITNWLNFLATILDRRIITRQNRYDAANGAILLYLKGTSRGLLRKLA
ncbi:MAG: FGGY-family carbohydrate kinase, partial [bacterium]|nr:FGGY-family carbohydrate kinase [bacterium]